VLRKMAEALGICTGQTHWFEILKKIEDLMIREKHINANVDFYSSSAYDVLGIPVDLYTLVFALRPHIRLDCPRPGTIRTQQTYPPPGGIPGPKNSKYVPVDQR